MKRLENIILENKVCEIFERKVKSKFEKELKKLKNNKLKVVEIKDRNENILSYIEFDIEKDNLLLSYDIESLKEKNYLVMFIEKDNLVFLLLDENYEELMSYIIGIENIFNYL